VSKRATAVDAGLLGQPRVADQRLEGQAQPAALNPADPTQGSDRGAQRRQSIFVGMKDFGMCLDASKRRSSFSLAASAGGRFSLAASSSSRRGTRAFGRFCRARVARGLSAGRLPIFWPLPIREMAA
jgi:hypothetical protein